MKNLLLIAFFIFTFSIVKAQGPPAMAEPTNSNKLLIDELMEVSSYKVLFERSCISQIDNISKKNKWTNDKLEKTKAKLNFQDFKNFTVYNAFSSLTTEELKHFIAAYKSLKKRKIETKFFLFNPIISNNISNYLTNFIIDK
ncbi:hypothetical protein D3C87_483560 [compost metagenome]|uniref:hypothetical protein n=1 Tax=Pedobacter ghigonis TaxID=2730403 RepID=UPI000FAE792D|nr:hypothetical protein [Pedobacter ghigonis]